MLTLLSTLISFLAGGIPKLLDFFQDKSDKKHELALASMQNERELQFAERGFVAQQRVEEIRLDQVQTQTAAEVKQSIVEAQQAELTAVYAHDESLNEGTSEWMRNLRASVRPVVTYGFFLLLVFVDVAGFIYGWYQDVDFTTMLELLWDAETQALFASIIAFHFGGRAFGK